jgi:hypothetical protein
MSSGESMKTMAVVLRYVADWNKYNQAEKKTQTVFLFMRPTLFDLAVLLSARTASARMETPTSFDSGTFRPKLLDNTLNSS